MAVRAPPRRAPPPPPRVRETVEGADTIPESEAVNNWIAKKARQNLLKRQFSFELEQGILGMKDVETYPGLPIEKIQDEIRNIRMTIELYKHEHPEIFMRDLIAAIRSGNLDFDFFLWDPDHRQSLQEYQDKEIVYYRKRTTAFTLEKPCPNCGKNDLIAEAAVFTRAADEAVDQFATCKNCSARYRLQAVL